MLYRVNYLYDGRYVSLFAEAENEEEAYDNTYSKIDNAKEIVHLGTNKVELAHIEYLDYIPWYKKDGEKMFCYKCFVKDNKLMAKCPEIEANKNKDTRQMYLELEVSYNKDKYLEEFHLLMQDLDGKDWSDPELIGSEVNLHDPNGEIIGHTLMSDEEFNYICHLAKNKLDEVYDEFDFDDKEDETC